MSEEGVVKESPTLEAPPAQEKPAEEAKTSEQYAALLTELEKAGVTSAKQLEGKFQAASERGHLANILGEVKSENAELKRMLMEMQSSQKKARSTGYEDDTQPGSIDLGDLVEKRVQAVIEKEKRSSLEAQQRAWQAWNQIQSDEDYHLISDKWEARMRDPNFAIQLQAGTVDPVAEYQKMLRSHYKSSVKLAADTIRTLTTGMPQQKVHVEGTARVRQETPAERSETQKQVDSLREKVSKGKLLTEDDELAALQAVLLRGR